ncbi:hypothetical protein [Flavilitoribacter nigricans]|uniref:Response regulatory domain-containing protein n=1 Tax=Flavilitoribacter nigricans (strain ATCC 23147 / DSM 23189 / NBRC 102662 / NCIMB 1420 / SS-2) TaxID=1122177 RepID=A0A2D0N4P2_FLAN2|nr:hypothetical protein [Flavilitoribacter nigricans]PHN03358.1 hypothetical protein CRP01_27115 [Flavilitoribacter nigricans DSM 23189 = NBRC 102662]
MIDQPLSILIISSNSKDIETVKSKIRSFAPNSLYVVARNEANLKKRIGWLDYHMVICDHQLPHNQAQKANIRLRITMPYLPFILITDCPEMENGFLSKESSSWSVRAIIGRSHLDQSGAVIQSVYNNSAETVEQERNCQKRIKQKNLLLQKFESLLKQALRPLNSFTLEELSRMVFNRHKIIGNFIS